MAATIAPIALLPALSLMFFCDGASHAVRSALVQARAADGERATLASAASAMDMFAKTASLPAAAWLFARWDRRGAVAALVAASLAGWALATWRRGRAPED